MLIEFIRAHARPYYLAEGPNSWRGHIMCVLDQAASAVREMLGRDLSIVEQAAILFHDSSVRYAPDKVDHHLKGAAIARSVLHGVLADKDVEEVATAIAEHVWTPDGSTPRFSTLTGEVLATGDYNPPSAMFILSKGMKWHRRHDPEGTPDLELLAGALRQAKKSYGTGGLKRPPRLYEVWRKTELLQLARELDSLTAEPALLARIRAWEG